jgi:hypothetical protein
MLHKEEEGMLMTKCTERGPIGRLRRNWKFNMKRDIREREVMGINVVRN